MSRDWYLAFAGAAPEGFADGIRPELLAEVVGRARSAFPRLALVPTLFLAHLGSKIEPTDADPSVTLLALHTTDLFLACACAHGVAGAARALEERHGRSVRVAIARIDPSPTFIDEATQRVRERVLLPSHDGRPRIADYRGRGSLDGWLSVTAARLALNMQREPRPVSDDVESVLAEITDPEIKVLKDHYRPQVGHALAEALRSLSDREQLLLRLEAKGMSQRRVAAMYRVDQSTIHRWLRDARKQLQAELVGRLKATLGVGDEEIASIVHLVMSQVDAGLSLLLEQSPSD